MAKVIHPLDFVKTPKGNIALVTETNRKGQEASIDFIGGGNPDGEHNAWWSASDLKVIDSLSHLIAKATRHPFGNGRKDIKTFLKPRRG